MNAWMIVEVLATQVTDVCLWESYIKGISVTFKIILKASQ